MTDGVGMINVWGCAEIFPSNELIVISDRLDGDIGRENRAL